MRDNFSPDILMSILIEEFNFADIEIPDWSDPDEIRKQVRLLTHRQQLRDLRIKIIDVIGVLSELARQEQDEISAAAAFWDSEEYFRRER